MTQRSQNDKPLTTNECGGTTPAILLSTWINLGMQLVESTRGGLVKVGSVMKEQVCLYLSIYLGRFPQFGG